MRTTCGHLAAGEQLLSSSARMHGDACEGSRAPGLGHTTPCSPTDSRGLHSDSIPSRQLRIGCNIQGREEYANGMCETCMG